MKLKSLNILVLSFFIFTVLIVSCTKYADPSPYIEDEGDSSSTVLKTRKVLLINIDGLGGKVLESTQPSNIFGLINHAKYNFNTYEGDTTTEVAAWKTLMSGISYFSHSISDSTWIAPEVDGDFEEARPYYSSLLEYMVITNPKLKSYAVTPWAGLYNNGGFLYATSSDLTTDDQQSADSIVSKLSNDNYGLIIGELNGYANAGIQHGFSSTEANNALATIDEYVGKFVNAIKNRSTYQDEDWLIILNSQFGGDGLNVVQNGFRIMYNEKLSKEEVVKSGFYSSWTASRSMKETAVMQSDNGYYDPALEDFTISFDLLLQASTKNYPDIIGKAGTINKQGWALFQNGDNFELDINSASSIRAKRFGSKKIIDDSQWHNISFTIGGAQSNRKLYVYVDGVLDQTGTSPLDISNIGSISSADPMTLGVLYENSSSGLPIAFHNIKIWRAALSADEIAKAVSTVKMEDNPQYSNLIGYWNCEDGHGKYFKNSISSKPDFVLGSAMTWTQITPVPNSFAGDTTNTNFSIDPDNTDIAPNVFTWLRTNMKSDWGWVSPWISDFAYEYGVQTN